MSINQNFPNVWASLVLDFENSKTLDPRITFTRSSTATYVGSDGLIKTAAADEARFDHDPETGESLGLLIEESRTNYEVYSSSIHTAYTASSGTGTVIRTASTATITPDGTSTTDAIIEDTSTNTQHTIIDAVINTFTQSTAVWTHSVFVKLISGSRLFASRIYGTGNDDVYVEYNLSTGTSSDGTSANNQVISHGMDEYPNGWWRCWVSFTAPGDAEGWLLGLADGSAAELPFYDGDGTSGFYIWGSQLEQGSFPTSYIPTSGSTLTRSVDEATITGTNFTDWYNSSEGTIFAKYSAGTYVSEVPFSISKTGDEINQIIAISSSSTGPISGVIPTIVVTDDGPQTGVTIPIYPVDGDVIKTAIVYKENDFAIASGIGGDVGFASDSSGTIPTVDFARIGKYPYYGIWQNRPIARIMYYPERLTDTQLQNLTK